MWVRLMHSMVVLQGYADATVNMAMAHRQTTWALAVGLMLTVETQAATKAAAVRQVSVGTGSTGEEERSKTTLEAA